MIGLYVLVATVAVALVVGGVLRRRDGRLRPVGARPGSSSPGAGAVRAPSDAVDPDVVDPNVVDPNAVDPDAVDLGPELAELGAAAGDRATLLQFSSAFCAPCRATRVLLADVARIVPGVVHVEVDAESHLELVRRLGVRRTPTVFILDGGRRVVSRASGAPPSRAAVFAAVGGAVPGGAVPGGAAARDEVDAGGARDGDIARPHDR